jgi:hypothetical protein
MVRSSAIGLALRSPLEVGEDSCRAGCMGLPIEPGALRVPLQAQTGATTRNEGGRRSLRIRTNLVPQTCAELRRLR